jgi:glycosyltransferase involved in cell wall biosynthesis
VFLGAETDLFPRRNLNLKAYREEDPISVIFYGQFIPMHGVDIIIHAARLLIEAPIRWTIIGSGQVEPMISSFLAEKPLPNLTWIPWVPYTKLSEFIHAADIALGIFGESEKAETSIPNKVFQILSTGTPLLTRDSKAIRELLDPALPGIYLVPPQSPKAIVDALHKFSSDRAWLASMELHAEKTKLITPSAIGNQISLLISETIEQHASRSFS